MFYFKFAEFSGRRNTKMSNRNIIVKDEEEEAQSLNNFILSHLDKFFVDHIPIASFADMQPAC